MPESDNPYAAPQAPLQNLPVAIQLPPAKERNYLWQGIMAGLQLGGIAGLIVTVVGVFFWGIERSLMNLLPILVSIISISTFVGTVIGGAVQLLALVFGTAPREETAHNARDQFDNTGFTPPHML